MKIIQFSKKHTRFSTTVRLEKVIIAIIDHSAALIGLSRNALMCTLLDYAVEKEKDNHPINSTVTYQPHLPEDHWETISIRFKSGQYERNTDFRKIFKISVSYVLALAVRYYLKEIIHMSSKTPVKKIVNFFSPSFHFIDSIIINNTRLWQLCWDEKESIGIILNE